MSWLDLEQDIAEEFGSTRLSRIDSERAGVVIRRGPGTSLAAIERSDERLSKKWAAERNAPRPARAKAKPRVFVSAAAPSSGTCEWCGELWDRETSLPARFCSEDCRRRHWRHLNAQKHRDQVRRSHAKCGAQRRAARVASWVTCGHCKGQFHPGPIGQIPKFCSVLCRGRAYDSRPKPAAPTRQCAVCSTEFAATMPHARFCSSRCRHLDNNRTQRARTRDQNRAALDVSLPALLESVRNTPAAAILEHMTDREFDLLRRRAGAKRRASGS